MRLKAYRLRAYSVEISSFKFSGYGSRFEFLGVVGLSF